MKAFRLVDVGKLLLGRDVGRLELIWCAWVRSMMVDLDSLSSEVVVQNLPKAVAGWPDWVSIEMWNLGRPRALRAPARLELGCLLSETRSRSTRHLVTHLSKLNCPGLEGDTDEPEGWRELD